MEPSIILFTKKNIEKIMKDPASSIEWAYLGENSISAIGIETKAPKGWKRISTADKLQKVARETKEGYVDYISKIEPKKDLWWWASRVSEKNPFVSKAFLHICYLKVAKLLMVEYEGITIIVENDDVFDSIKTSLNIDNTRMVDGNRKMKIIENITGSMMKKTWFLFSNIRNILSVKRLKKADKHRKYTMVHTFANKGSFDSEGNFREAYFKEMPNWLRENGDEVKLLVRILDNSAHEEITKKLAKNKEVIIWHQYLSIWDVFGAFFAGLIRWPEKNKHVFEGFDISDIVYMDEFNDWNDNRRSSDILLSNAIDKMAKEGVEIDKFIYTYENHCWEKVAIVSLRKNYPDCKIIGYQHAALSDMQLNYLFSKEESESMPFPDKLIVSGEYYLKFFEKSGYPKNALALGGSFRFGHLAKMKVIGKKQNKILVTFPMDEKESTEVYYKVVRAFKDSDIEVLLKFHPFSSPDRIMNSVGKAMPENFKLTTQPIPDLLNESAGLIYTMSTTCIEAIAAGVLPIHIESDYYLDMDQLGDEPNARLLAKTSDEILASAKKAIESKEKNKFTGLVSEKFAAVNRKTMMAAIG